MTAAQVADRCPRSRRSGASWRAPCPSHAGTNPTALSIREGRGGVLLRCHRGCEVAAIVAAIGLELRDLFTRPLDEPRAAPQQRPSKNALRNALLLEERRFREDHAISDGQRLVAADLIAIRRTVSARLGVSLPPVDRRISDSYAGGYERDPLWPMLLEQAWLEAWVRRDGRKPCCSIEQFRAHGLLGFDLLAEAEREAERSIRAIVAKGRAA